MFPAAEGVTGSVLVADGAMRGIGVGGLAAVANRSIAGVGVGGLIVNRILLATSPDPFLRARHEQERVYLDEIDRRFAGEQIVRIPQLPSDVHGVATLERIAAGILQS